MDTRPAPTLARVSLVLVLAGISRCRCSEGPLVFLSSLPGSTDAAASSVDAGRCIGDTHEPDDDFNTVVTRQPISGMGAPVAFVDQVACAGEVDLFHAYADCCQYAGAELSWDPARGSLQMDLLWSDGGVMTLDRADDIQWTDAGTINEKRALHGGSFVVRVRNPSSLTVPYRVDVVAPVFGP